MVILTDFASSNAIGYAHNYLLSETTLVSLHIHECFIYIGFFSISLKVNNEIIVPPAGSSPIS